MIKDKNDYLAAIKQLNKWTEEYDKGTPQVPDKTWDQIYFDIQDFERETNIISEDSPTQKVVFRTVSKLEKVTHNHPMLSLDKTKDLKVVKSFLRDQDFIAMCKMDGLTCSLTYENGYLVSAETRGNGLVGENILHNALTIPSIPKRIVLTQKIVIDGEIICTYKNFEEFSTEYKNPRNFASGSIRLLNSEECNQRKLTFVAWDVIEGIPTDLLSFQLYQLSQLGFTIVPFQNPSDDLERLVQNLKDLADEYSYPIDGVVFKFNSKKYGESLGATDHHFKNAIAYKFYDESYETEVKDIEWTMGRTGQLTPVLIYNDIEIEGSVCNRASLHNISIMKQTMKGAYPGQRVFIYKANQIIPQVAAVQLNNPRNIPLIEIPKTCPYCGEPTEIRRDIDSEVLYCTNPNCSGKLINRLDHFCGKKGLDIKGISKATIEKLIDWEWLNKFIDIYKLKNHQSEWILKEGFGEKSVQNILDSIDKSRQVELWRVIAAAGIPNIGITASKQLADYFQSYEKFRAAVKEKFDFTTLPDFGEVTYYSLLKFDYTEIDEVISYALTPFYEEKANTKILENLQFCITGKLKLHKNRNELKQKIEEAGGKVTDSVTSKTSYLVNNDVNSSSSKNLTAKKLNIPILTEEELMSMLSTG